MPDIPPEAVQAAAKASSLHFEFCDEPRWQDCAKCVRVVERTERALKAAAPILAGHALRDATREQHEDMIRRVTQDAINKAKPGLLALMEQQADQAITQRAEAIRAAERGPLLALIRDLADAEECWYDHHGGCQAHGYLSLEPGERCPHAEAKELLGTEEQPGV